MQLNKLVLPAPFGPINPTICPLAISKETSSSAATPPKRTLTPRIASKASLNAEVPVQTSRRELSLRERFPSGRFPSGEIPFGRDFLRDRSSFGRDSLR